MAKESSFPLLLWPSHGRYTANEAEAKGLSLCSLAISDSTESPGVRLRTGDPSTCPGQANTGHQTDKWPE